MLISEGAVKLKQPKETADEIIAKFVLSKFQPYIEQCENYHFL